MLTAAFIIDILFGFFLFAIFGFPILSVASNIPTVLSQFGLLAFLLLSFLSYWYYCEFPYRHFHVFALYVAFLIFHFLLVFIQLCFYFMSPLGYLKPQELHKSLA